MKRYFCVSDIHGFYDELIEALNIAGYDKENPNHMLVVLGDVFDRGPKTFEMYKFLSGLPRERKILVRGNHEDMFLALIKKEYPDKYDFANKTVESFCQLANKDAALLEYGLYYNFGLDIFSNKGFNYAAYWKSIKKLVELTGIIKWLNSDEWVNYYEIDRFIFMHAFIPLIRNNRKPLRLSEVGQLQYNPNWRIDTLSQEWYESRWGCPWQLYLDGLFKEEEAQGKTLVCGHWHTGDFYRYIRHSPYPFNTNIFYDRGIIGLDGGAWQRDGKLKYSCNVLVIKDGKCYNKRGVELTEENPEGLLI